MAQPARIQRALDALEARRVQLERLISEDLERKFLSVSEPIERIDTNGSVRSTPEVFGKASTTETGSHFTMTWLA